MKIIAIEEHWNSASIHDALDRLPGGERDESVAFNAMVFGRTGAADPVERGARRRLPGLRPADRRRPGDLRLGLAHGHRLGCAPADPARHLRPPPRSPARPRPLGEMLLFWTDRADSLSGVAKHLQRRVSDYITTNIHITSSGMLQERLVRHTLDFTSAGQVLFSTDYPFHQPSAAAVRQFFDAIPDPADRSKVASGNAEALFHLA